MIKEFEDLKKELEKLPKAQQKEWVDNWLDEIKWSSKFESSQGELKSLAKEASKDYQPVNTTMDFESLKNALKNFTEEKQKILIHQIIEKIHQISNEDDMIRDFGYLTQWDFWNDPREDIYQDYLPKK
ncbi:hypothetical protein [Ekhidna sp.]|uniref:hypothetical protein n=1 Tax=Ekhidna sp. TaxID=2608089 RepID=UPI003CCB84FE